MNVLTERQLVMITGATSSIGCAIAKQLSRDYDLLLHGRDDDKLEKLMLSLPKGNHVAWKYDLSHVEALQVDFEKFVSAHNIVIHKFVHTAGVAQMAAAKMVDLPLLSKTFAVNTFSAMLLVSSLLKSRVAGTSVNNVVLISSVTGVVGSRGNAVYGASKGALTAYAKSIASEIAPRVRINVVCPGLVDTAMSRDVLSNEIFRAAAERRHPMGIGKPENISGIVEFLLSDKASWITGQQIFVDGGALCDLTFK